LILLRKILRSTWLERLNLLCKFIAFPLSPDEALAKSGFAGFSGNYKFMN